MKPKILFVGDLNRQLDEYKQFSDNFECIDYVTTTRQQVIRDFQTKFHDIEAIYGAWLGFSSVGGFNGDLLDNTPNNVKIIAVCSVGYDKYDHKALKERGIVLTNVPATDSRDSVADMALYYSLESFRHLKFTHVNFTKELPHDTIKMRRLMLTGTFNKELGKVIVGTAEGYAYGETIAGRPVHNPKNHNAVIFGFGQIGKTIGQRLASIGMKIHYIKRNRLSPEEEGKLSFEVNYHSSLSAVTAFADLIVLSAPATPETKHAINSDFINLLQNPIRIINVGRGSIIDEQALIKGLKLGKVLFAGLDVHEKEPEVNPELYERQDVVITPHLGASTVENFDSTAITALKNIELVLNGKEPLTRVN